MYLNVPRMLDDFKIYIIISGLSTASHIPRDSHPMGGQKIVDTCHENKSLWDCIDNSYPAIAAATTSKSCKGNPV